MNNDTDQNELPEPWLPSHQVQTSTSLLELDKVINKDELHGTVRGLAMFIKHHGENYGTCGYFISALNAEELSYYEQICTMSENSMLENATLVSEAMQVLTLVAMLLLRLEGLTDIQSEESLLAVERLKTILQVEYIARKSGMIVNYGNLTISTLPDNSKHLEKVIADGKTVVQWKSYLKGE